MSDCKSAPVLHLGGGGASAPSTYADPMLAPGVHRPDWPTPEYAKLPWQRKLKVVEAYADGLGQTNEQESTQSFAAIINCLQQYQNGDELPIEQLTAALTLIEEERSRSDIWQSALEVDQTPVRGDDELSPEEINQILQALLAVRARS